jgi:SAM-dependent methyltransferase
MDNLYDAQFFHSMTEDAVPSAAVVVPLAMLLVKPESVVDVGCGAGAWLAAFRAAGVQRILGIDGDYVDRQSLRIPTEAFRAADLSHELNVNQSFDLCVSLEVAEHLPASVAAGFVRSLVQLAPVIMFSAAVPEQTGTGHINEQWPEYWMALFAGHGYQVIDPFRGALWRDYRVAWWYRQNMFLYVDPAARPDLVRDYGLPGSELRLLHADIVHRFQTTIASQSEHIAQLSTGRGALRVLRESIARTLARWTGLGRREARPE